MHTDIEYEKAWSYVMLARKVTTSEIVLCSFQACKTVGSSVFPDFIFF